MSIAIRVAGIPARSGGRGTLPGRAPSVIRSPNEPGAQLMHDDPVREPAPRLVATTVHGRYLAQPPGETPGRGWLVGFHGYAQSAAEFLPGLCAIPGSRAWLVVAIQALHPFYNRGAL